VRTRCGPEKPKGSRIAPEALDFSRLRGLDLNQRPLGYEPFSNQHESQRTTKKASEISASRAVALGLFGLSLGATSWVIPG